MNGPFSNAAALDARNVLGTTPKGKPLQTVSAVAQENLAAGAMVHLTTEGAITQARNANAQDGTRPARGYVLTDVSAGGHATVYLPGSINTATPPLKPGDYYLGQTPGSITTTPSIKMGTVVQYVGTANPDGTLSFNPNTPAMNVPPTPGPPGPPGTPGLPGGLPVIPSLELLANLLLLPAEAAGHTISDILDATLGATLGAIILRGTTGWTLILPSMAGLVLTDQGPGFVPIWQPPTGTTFTIVTTVDLAAGDLVSFGATGLILADATDDTKPANGFVLTAFTAGDTATVYKPGSELTGLSALTGGGLCYLSTAGALTQSVPSSGASQIVGTAIDATRVLFLPGTVGLV